MRERGHSVAAAAPGLCSDPETVAALDAMGIACHHIPLRRTGMNPLGDIRLLVALVRLMRSKRPDLVFGYTIKAAIYGLIAAAIARVPRRHVLITGVGYAFTGKAAGKRWLTQQIAILLYRTALRFADTIFFQNPDDERLFRQRALLTGGARSVVVNGSGIDLEQFAPAALPSGPPQFLLVARLLSTKGIREYAAAAEMVRRAHPEAEFHLVGGFDENPDAIAVGEVQAWQSKGILAWHGEVDDVRPRLADCHVFVLPSYREGTPRSVLEAMAMGRPIITTDAPGCRETVVDGENGFLVPPGSIAALAEVMERFLAKPKLFERMGRRSRELAERKYDVREVNRRMMRHMELA